MPWATSLESQIPGSTRASHHRPGGVWSIRSAVCWLTLPSMQHQCRGQGPTPTLSKDQVQIQRNDVAREAASERQIIGPTAFGRSAASCGGSHCLACSTKCRGKGLTATLSKDQILIQRSDVAIESQIGSIRASNHRPDRVWSSRSFVCWLTQPSMQHQCRGQGPTATLSKDQALIQRNDVAREPNRQH